MPPHLLPVCLWYGLLSLAVLGAFALFGFEVQCGFDICKELDDDEAWNIVKATLHINGLAMAAANLLLGIACVGLAGMGEDWRSYFAGSIFVVGCFITYSRHCEKNLVAFVRKVQDQPHLGSR